MRWPTGVVPATTGGPDGASADAGANCRTAPATTCEGDACNACTNANCETRAAATTTGVTPTAGCDILASVERQARCETLYACMRDNACVRNSDPSACWCGTLDPEACATGPALGDGPCLQQVIDAAESSKTAATISARATDSAFAIGAAVNLATCRSVSCSRLSDTPTSACLL